LLFRPGALFEIGFQLSFLAVFFIIVLYQPLREKLKLGNFFSKMFVLSIVAQLGTAPLSIYYFHSFPLTGAVISIILIPLTTIIIYLGLLTLLLPIGCIAWLLTIVIKTQEWLVDTIASIPYTTITNLYPTWWQVMLVYLLLLCIIARSHIRWKREDFNL
jgi:competence protein ComEC